MMDTDQTEYATIEEAWDALQAVPSYVEQQASDFAEFASVVTSDQDGEAA